MLLLTEIRLSSGTKTKISSVKLLTPGENWASLALTDGKLMIRDQKQMKCVVVRK